MYAGKEGFWDAARTMEEVEQAGYFKPEGAEQSKLPPALQAYHFLPASKKLSLACTHQYNST